MTQSKKNVTVAITGGIGSGKTTVALTFRRFGYPTISCDEITERVYKIPKVRKELKRAFPNAVSGRFRVKVDKKAISDAVFTDQAKYLELKRIVTDRIFDLAIKRAKKIKGLVFIEVPLLFEGNYQNCFDSVVVVKRQTESRISAVCKRSNLSRQEVLDRMAKQVDYETFDFSPYYVINNDGDLEYLSVCVQDIIEKLNR